MKAQTFAIMISAFIICSLFYGYYSTELSRAILERDLTIESLETEKRKLSKIVSARETIKQKRIELDYLFPIHIDDWIAGPSALTSAYGKRTDDEVGGPYNDGFHSGLDLWSVSHVGSTWQARIVAVSDGWCEHWINDPVKGRYILIHHSDGNESEYHHLSKAYIRDGDEVKKGMVIARQGSTGFSTGAHLHFELWINEKAVNPLKYISVPEE